MKKILNMNPKLSIFLSILSIFIIVLFINLNKNYRNTAPVQYKAPDYNKIFSKYKDTNDYKTFIADLKSVSGDLYSLGFFDENENDQNVIFRNIEQRSTYDDIKYYMHYVLRLEDGTYSVFDLTEIEEYEEIKSRLYSEKPRFLKNFKNKKVYYIADDEMSDSLREEMFWNLPENKIENMKTDFFVYVKEMPSDVDYETFQNVHSKLLLIGRDKNNIYVGLYNNKTYAWDEIISIESEELELISSDLTRIPGNINPKSVYFLKTKDEVYYYSFSDFLKIKEADPTTFSVFLDFMHVSKDKNSVFLKDRKIENADQQTYEPIYDGGFYRLGTIFAKDKKHFFADHCILNGVDVSTVSLKTPLKHMGNTVFNDKYGDFISLYDSAHKSENCSIQRI